MQKSNGEVALGRFVVRESGTIGQESVSPRGQVIAWTTDQIVAQIIFDRLNQIIGHIDRAEANAVAEITSSGS